MAVAYSEEPSPLGTGGALRLALPHLDAPSVLLLNGDSYCGLRLAAFATAHRRRGADVSLALVRVNDAGRYGRVDAAADGRVTAFVEKEASGGPGWISAGVYLVERRLVEGILAGRPISLERDLLPVWVAQGRVFAHQATGPFLDIGTPESYGEAEAFFRSVGGAGRPVFLSANS
jgi:D-glycero-alpha-D-manno-heptose 1-phosphate guanylyltransferase